MPVVRFCLILAAIVLVPLIMLLALYNPATGSPAAAAEDVENLYAPASDPSHFRADSPIGPQYVDNELMLQAKSGVSREQIEALAAQSGAEVIGWDLYANSYQLRFANPFDSLEAARQAAGQMAQSDLTEAGWPNYVYSLAPSDAYYPNDRLWAGEWEREGGLNWGAEAIHAPEMWFLLNGLPTGNVNVGVIDNRFYDQHEDLRFSELLANTAGMERKTAGSPIHGTHVAGIIAARFNNGVGIAGLATNATLFGASMDGLSSGFSGTGNGEVTDVTLASLRSALTYLIEVHQCRVINFSYGAAWESYADYARGCRSRGETPETEDAYNQRLEHVDASTFAEINAPLEQLLKLYLAGGREFVIVKSAGNNNDVAHMPWNAEIDVFSAIADPELRDRIIIVGSASRLKGGEYAVSSYSNHGSRVDLIAPGNEILSTAYSSTLLGKLKSDYSTLSGTSMAAPQVAGVAAALFGANQMLTGAQVKQFIVETATGNYAYEPGEGLRQGHSYWQGYPGDTYPMLDAYAALGKGVGLEEGEAAQPNDAIAVVLTLDTSGSMSGTPLSQTKSAAGMFADSILNMGASLGLVEFNSSAYVVADMPATAETVHAGLDGLYADGGTNMGDGLINAWSLLDAAPAGRRILILMSDGQPQTGILGSDLLALADRIKADGVTIFTLGYFLQADDRASSQSLMEMIASPGCHYEVDDINALSLSFADMAEQSAGMRYLYMRVACPVDVRVESNGEVLDSTTDQLRTSFGVLSFEDGDDSYREGDEADVDRRTKVLRLKEGEDYQVEITGTGVGEMDFTLALMNENGNYTDFRRFTDIPVQRGSRVSILANTSVTTTLQLDADGNGSVDTSYSAAANGDMQREARSQALQIVALILVFCCVVTCMILRRDDLGFPCRRAVERR